MLLPNPKDVIHKVWMTTVLTALADHPILSQVLGFKGGTCAAMLGLLDRFSVDLDFELLDNSKKDIVQKEMEKTFTDIGLEIKDQSKIAPQFFLKYPAPAGERSTLKIDVSFPPTKANQYKPCRLDDIDRVVLCQTPETMFANKLVAVLDRHEKTGSLAGRDFFDLHQFFAQGLKFNGKVLEERRHTDVSTYLKELAAFIQHHLTQTVLDEDLNTLLPPTAFKTIRLVLKPQLLVYLKEAIKQQIPIKQGGSPLPTSVACDKL